MPYSDLPKLVFLLFKRTGLFAIMCHCAETTVVETVLVCVFGDDVAIANGSGIDVWVVEIRRHLVFSPLSCVVL